MVVLECRSTVTAIQHHSSASSFFSRLHARHLYSAGRFTEVGWCHLCSRHVQVDIFLLRHFKRQRQARAVPGSVVSRSPAKCLQRTVVFKSVSQQSCRPSCRSFHGAGNEKRRLWECRPRIEMTVRNRGVTTVHFQRVLSIERRKGESALSH